MTPNEVKRKLKEINSLEIKFSQNRGTRAERQTLANSIAYEYRKINKTEYWREALKWHTTERKMASGPKDCFSAERNLFEANFNLDKFKEAKVHLGFAQQYAQGDLDSLQVLDKLKTQIALI